MQVSERRFDALAHVHLLPSDAGGRLSNTPGRSWKCRLKIDGSFHDVMLFNKEDKPFRPGREAHAELTFLDIDSIAQPRMVELPVEVWEINKVGDGTAKIMERGYDNRLFA